MKRLFALLLCLMLLTVPAAHAAESSDSTYHCTSLYEFKYQFSALAQDMLTEYTIICSEELFAQLTADDFALLHDIEYNNGMLKRDLKYNTSTRRLIYSDILYYPGFKVVAASRSGLFEKLSIDETELYDLAMQLVTEAEAATSDTLSLEKYLHDLITRRTVYYSTDSTEPERKDTALGALVDGLADCDGYADAFYLLGNLAGFNVRYVRGLTPNSENNSHHLWNAVHLNGEWYAMDVTWDDFESDGYNDCSPFYAFFNIGADRLSLSHSWNDDALLEPIAAETGIANYYNAVGGNCTDWNYAAGYMNWRLEQGQLTDSIMLVGFDYDNDALNTALCNTLTGSWSWNTWYRSYGDLLYIIYYFTK